jgi:hypothetical protein
MVTTLICTAVAVVWLGSLALVGILAQPAAAQGHPGAGGCGGPPISSGGAPRDAGAAFPPHGRPVVGNAISKPIALIFVAPAVLFIPPGIEQRPGGLCH